MALAEYRSAGMTYGIPKVFAVLFKAKAPLAEIKQYLQDETVMNALKKVNSDDSLNTSSSVIKAVFALYRRKDTLTEGSLQSYYDFILGDGKNVVDSLYEDIITADKGGSWKDFVDTLNMLMYRSKPAAAATQPIQAPVNPPNPTYPPSIASSVPASEPSIGSSASGTSALTTSALTTSGLTTSTKPRITLKAKAPSVASTTTVTSVTSVTSGSSTATIASGASGASGTSTSTDFSAKGGLSAGYKIHIKDDSLNKEKHKDSALKDVHNTRAKLLVIDIESCTDVIYPVAIDLAPESTNQDILDYIVKVLTEASQKNLKCHTSTSYHVFTIRAMTDSSRVLYISVAK